MSSFELFVGGVVSRKMLELPVDEHWHALYAFEVIANNPVTVGLAHWEGEDGHTRYLRVVHGWTITFRVDHAERNVRILDLDRS
jgi:hypothetical protein